MDISIEEVHVWEALSKDELPRLRQIIAHREGSVIGKVKLADRPICEQKLRFQFPDTPMIYQLYVEPSVRRQGIGSQLMDICEQLVKSEGGHQLLLCVMPTNGPARQMYESRNYEYVGDRTVESVWRLKTGIERVELRPMFKRLIRNASCIFSP